MSSFAAVFASMMAQLASGVPIYKITAPSSIQAPISQLEVSQGQFFSNGNTLLEYNKIDGEEDPVKRLALVFQGLFSTSHVFGTDKPFNPVLGEYIRSLVVVDGSRFDLIIEQAHHTPPVSCISLKGPTFSMISPLGMDATGGFRPGLNSLSILFPDSVFALATKTKGTMTFLVPGIRIGPLFYGGKRATCNAGAFFVKDGLTGMQFKGQIKSGFKVKGDILDGENNFVDSVDGDLIGGVIMKSTGQVWAKGVPQQNVEILIDEETLKAPLYSQNVWSKVFTHMKAVPPNYSKADLEKGIVEQNQRKLDASLFDSQFGFKTKYSKP